VLNFEHANLTNITRKIVLSTLACHNLQPDLSTLCFLVQCGQSPSEANTAKSHIRSQIFGQTDAYGFSLHQVQSDPPYTPMPAPHKHLRRQKTYGKSLKLHPNELVGRNLWTEIEIADSTPNANSTFTVSQCQLMAEVISPTIPISTPPMGRASDNRRDAHATTVLEESITGQSKVKIMKPVVCQMDNLKITDDASRPTSTLVISRSITESSTSLVRDNENECCSTSTDISNILRTPLESEQRSLYDTTPRNRLPERNSIKDSPHRKHGLRKKFPAVTLPKNNELSGKGDDLHGHIDLISVLEVDLKNIAMDEEHVIEKRSATLRTKRSRKHMLAAVPETLQTDGLGVIVNNHKQVLRSHPMLSWQKTEKRESIRVDSTDEGRIDFKLFGPAETTYLPYSPEVTDVSNTSEAYQLIQLSSEQKIVNFATYIHSILKNCSIQKLGEASYSEVFLQLGSDPKNATVLKVIPFGAEDQCEVKSIVQEVRITKTMATIEGFIGFRG